MNLTQDDISEDHRKRYDHRFDTTIETELESDGSLIYSMRVRNNGDKPMPISPGAHPFWEVNHESKKDVRIIGLQGFDAKSFDWLVNTPDTPYDFSGRAEIILPDKIIIIEEITPGDPVVKKLNVWADEFNPDYDHDFLCVEPISRDKSQTHKKPIMLLPGGNWEMRLRFRVQFLEPQEHIPSDIINK